MGGSSLWRVGMEQEWRWGGLGGVHGGLWPYMLMLLLMLELLLLLLQLLA